MKTKQRKWLSVALTTDQLLALDRMKSEASAEKALPEPTRSSWVRHLLMEAVSRHQEIYESV